MNPTQSVIIAQLLSFALFWGAGAEAQRSATNALRRLRGDAPKPPAKTEPGPQMSVSIAAAWGILFVTLIVLTDIEATAPFGVGLAWLLFVSIALAYGVDALANVSRIITPPKPSGGKKRG